MNAIEFLLEPIHALANAMETFASLAVDRPVLFTGILMIQLSLVLWQLRRTRTDPADVDDWRGEE